MDASKLRRVWRFFFCLLVGFLLAGAGFLSLVKYGFQSHTDFKRFSLPYFLVLDSEIAQAPAVRNALEVSFWYFPQDGTAQALDEALIRGGDIQSAARDSRVYFERLGYRDAALCKQGRPGELVKNGMFISIEADAIRNKLRITKSGFATDPAAGISTNCLDRLSSF